MKKNRAEENALYYIGWCIIGLLIVLGMVFVLWHDRLEKVLPPCLLHAITGYYCPGCGGTRAVMYLLQGKFLKSAVYHPLVMYTAVVGGWFMVSQTVERLSKGKAAIGMGYRDIWLWIALALLGINFIIKNVCLCMGIDLLAAG